ncbi:pentapeptide repeat-containing protein [Alkalibaculum sp. M08DMB]|uniref:Pentapeptide repeat-containing protein n=1 Tax=Alkalibaculum sporogenes TaxID=2655001 RepID=A0A6A7KBZ9_9FIRM|nr:pentapeptide repeat-containing protein [Alkalibaculum sporogenes]MPW26811.1 pentapeptide repeat-containing protein [Alkalibaculum sporogenes]
MKSRNIYIDDISVFKDLKIDCGNCFSFCCVALYFSKVDGFPKDKSSGEPCVNLNSDFTCKAHKDLRKKGLKGCTSYDCFGAGQKVAKITYNGINWSKSPELAGEMFNVFLLMTQLHEMLWYLSMVYSLEKEETLRNIANIIIQETIEITLLKPEALLKLNIDMHREKVKEVLTKASEKIRSKFVSKNNQTLSKNYIGKNLKSVNLRGTDLSGALLLVTDLSNNDLSGVNLIGTDMRDTNIKATNLQNSLFITQQQVNNANGDSNTKLPASLTIPKYWSK